eukprot:gene27667-34419_t
MSLDKVFEALASAPRRKILAYLAEAEMNTSELAARFEMSAPAVSRHLSVLENAGLISSERRGQFVFYKLTADNVANTLTSYALELCPTGRPLKRESAAIAARRLKQHRASSADPAGVIQGTVRYAPLKSLWFSGMAGTALIGGIATFSWGALAVFVAATAFVLLFGHSLGSHRKLIHDSFQCPKWLEYALVYCGVQVGLAGPLGLLRQHELRDYAQRMPDCHDYLRHGRGFWRDGWWQIHCDLALDTPPALFRPGGGALPMAPSLGSGHLRIEYLWQDAAGVLQPVAAAARAPCPALNRLYCLRNPNGSDCIRHVRVSVCDPGDASSCRPVPFQPLLPLPQLNWQGLALPVSATTARAEALGYRTGSALCAAPAPPPA